jgi:hypothetical protein
MPGCVASLQLCLWNSFFLPRKHGSLNIFFTLFAVRYFTEQHEMQLQRRADVKTVANLVKTVRGDIFSDIFPPSQKLIVLRFMSPLCSYQCVCFLISLNADEL